MSKKILTKKQHIILLLLYTFRFINSKQIQEFLQHKDHRRINSWLKDLVEKEYVERDFTQVFGTLTKPAVYRLSKKGIQHISHSYPFILPKYNKRIARDANISKSFRIKSQIIADWYLTLFSKLTIARPSVQTGIAIIDNLVTVLTTGEVHNKAPLDTLQFFTPSYFPQNMLLRKIKPDAYQYARFEEGMIEEYLFVIDAYASSMFLKYTLNRIFDALSEYEDNEDGIHVLHINFLCPNHQVIIYMKIIVKELIKNYFSPTQFEVYFATRDYLYKWKSGEIEKIPWKIISSED